MKQEKQVALLEELQGLKNNRLFFLDEGVALSPIDRYACPDRFAQEFRDVMRATPLIGALASELPEPGSFITRDLVGLPVLLTRDREGVAHAFINVCRHRGARLVNGESGCKHSFSCPYHAWTWNSAGELRGIPHEKPGFPGIDRTAYGLKRLPATERHGVIWVSANPDAKPDFDAFLDPLAEDFSWLGMPELAVAHSDTIERSANWKLLVEGGLEAYHFKVTHKETIGPHFLDNLSSYERLGPHMRSILPRSVITSMQDQPKDNWSIRDVSNVLYSIFPVNQFLVMQDHVAWIELTPLAHDKTRIRLTTLAPKTEVTEDKAPHWIRNHAITSTTLEEDFEVNEAVQSGLASGTNAFLTFGRYEGALEEFNQEVEKRL